MKELSKTKRKILSGLDRFKERLKKKEFRACGYKVVLEIAAEFKIKWLVFGKEFFRNHTERVNDLLKLLGKKSAFKSNVENNVFLSGDAEVEKYGVCGVFMLPDYIFEESSRALEILKMWKRVVFLNGVQDPANVGGIMRVASAFGFDGVVADFNSADFFSPKVLRAAGGFIPEVMRVRRLEELLNGFKGQVYILDVEAIKEIEDVAFEEKFGVVLGSEGRGIILDKELLRVDFVSVKIPVKVESLNVYSAFSIFSYVSSLEG